jgi:hypothetical protein
MKFYGAKSIARVGLGIAFMSPRGDTLCYDFHLDLKQRIMFLNMNDFT